MSRRTLCLGALVWLTAACGGEAVTETVVIIDAEPSIAQRADHTTLVVTKSPQADAVEVHSDAHAPRRAKFPYVIALTPGEAADDQLYRLEVTALENGKAITAARLISGYVTHQTRYVRLLLEDACIDGPACSPEQTCHLGACVDAHVDVEKLTDDRDRPVDSTDAIALDPPANPGGGATPGGGASPGGGGGPSVDTGVVESIDLSTHHACAQKSSGSVACWGRNDRGQLGNGSTQATTTPVLVTGLNDAVEVAAADGFSCARRASGEVACWGANDKGQLGTGTIVDSSTPVAVVGLADVVQIVTDSIAMCARKRDNTVVCWGANDYGSLGDGTKFSSTVPVAVKDGVGMTQLAAGGLVMCARTLIATVLCWGSNTFGGLGQSAFGGSGPGAQSSVPYELFPGGASEVYRGATCARRSGSVWCWGDGWTFDGGSDYSKPFIAKSLASMTQIATSNGDGCALKSGGGVVCWGRNSSGRVGNGTTQNALAPVAVSGLSGVTSIAVSGAFSCAINSGGAVSCWGDNSYGQLGDYSGDQSNVPVRIKGL